MRFLCNNIHISILQAVNHPTKDGKEEVTTKQLELLLRQVINEPVQLRKPTAGTLFFCVFFWDSSDNLEGMGCAVLDFRNDISETNQFLTQRVEGIV